MKPYQEIRPSVYQLLLAIFLPSTGPQIEDGFPLFSDHACFGRQKCPTERFQDYGILRRDHPQQVWLVSGQRIGLWDPLDTIRLEGTVVKWSKPLWFAKECESTHWLREFPWFRVESQSPNRKSDMLGRFPGKFLGQLSITNSRMDVNCYVGLPKFTKKNTCGELSCGTRYCGGCNLGYWAWLGLTAPVGIVVRLKMARHKLGTAIFQVPSINGKSPLGSIWLELTCQGRAQMVLNAAFFLVDQVVVSR